MFENFTTTELMPFDFSLHRLGVSWRRWRGKGCLSKDNLSTLEISSYFWRPGRFFPYELLWKWLETHFFPIHRNNCSQFFFEKMVILLLVMAVYKRLGEMFVGCVLAIYAMSLCFLHVQYGEFQQCEKPKEIDNTKLKGALVLAIDLFRGWLLWLLWLLWLMTLMTYLLPLLGACLEVPWGVPGFLVG